MGLCVCMPTLQKAYQGVIWSPELLKAHLLAPCLDLIISTMLLAWVMLHTRLKRSPALQYLVPQDPQTAPPLRRPNRLSHQSVCCHTRRLPAAFEFVCTGWLKEFSSLAEQNRLQLSHLAAGAPSGALAPTGNTNSALPPSKAMINTHSVE